MIPTSQFALGGSLFGWTLDLESSFELLDYYYFDLGQKILDTADSYSQWKPGNVGGESETIIGQWLQSRKVPRDQIFLATKIGRKLDRQGYGKDTLRTALLESLQRLKVESVDMLYLHNAIEVDSTSSIIEALSSFRSEGLIDNIGLSNAPKSLIQTVSDGLNSSFGKTIASIQNHYNLIERDSSILPFDEYSKRTNFSMATEVLPWLRQNGVYSFPYHSLCRGILTNRFASELKVSENSIHFERTTKYLHPTVFELVQVLKSVAKKHQTSVSVVSLSWMRKEYKNTIPIISCNSLDQMLEAFGNVELDEVDFESLDILRYQNKSNLEN
jgi:aryl-alcohol dehydrogenase-like predicted oxidoreductase